MLTAVALGARDEDSLTSLAGRLARLERTLLPQDAFNLNAILGMGVVGAGSPRPYTAPLRNLANALLDAVDPDKPIEMALVGAGLSSAVGAGLVPA